MLRGKEAPNAKNLRGEGSLGGGSERGFLAKFFMFMLFFRGLRSCFFSVFGPLVTPSRGSDLAPQPIPTPQTPLVSSVASFQLFGPTPCPSIP